jgi:hypothetical protein
MESGVLRATLLNNAAPNKSMDVSGNSDVLKFKLL